MVIKDPKGSSDCWRVPEVSQILGRILKAPEDSLMVLRDLEGSLGLLRDLLWVLQVYLGYKESTKGYKDLPRV